MVPDFIDGWAFGNTIGVFLRNYSPGRWVINSATLTDEQVNFFSWQCGDLADCAPGRFRPKVTEAHDHTTFPSESNTHWDSPVATIPRDYPRFHYSCDLSIRKRGTTCVVTCHTPTSLVVQRFRDVLYKIHLPLFRVHSHRVFGQTTTGITRHATGISGCTP